MKKTFLVLTSVLGLVGQIASATSIRPPVRQLEHVTVKNLELRGNFMPPLPPGGITPMAIITVQVDSNGCTTSRDFQVAVTSRPDGQALTIVRTNADRCRAFFPEGTEVELRVPNVGFGNVFVTNPLKVTDRTTH